MGVLSSGHNLFDSAWQDPVLQSENSVNSFVQTEKYLCAQPHHHYLLIKKILNKPWTIAQLQKRKHHQVKFFFFKFEDSQTQVRQVDKGQDSAQCINNDLVPSNYNFFILSLQYLHLYL